MSIDWKTVEHQAAVDFGKWQTLCAAALRDRHKLPEGDGLEVGLRREEMGDTVIVTMYYAGDAVAHFIHQLDPRTDRLNCIFDLPDEAAS